MAPHMVAAVTAVAYALDIFFLSWSEFFPLCRRYFLHLFTEVP